MDMKEALERLVDTHQVHQHNLGHAPCFSASAYFPFPMSGDHHPYPVDNPTAKIIQTPEYVFVAQCKNCQREMHLDPDRPIPPAFCGLGMTHGCGSSEWHVFKRLIEVEATDEYVDDCVYSGEDDLPVGVLSLPPMTEKKAESFREKWNAVISRVRTESLVSLWNVSDYSQVKYEDL